MSPEDESGPLSYKAFVAYMESWDERNDRRFAAKWVEWVAKGGIGSILLAVLYMVLTHVGIR